MADLPDYWTAQDIADHYDRAVGPIEKYVQVGILIPHDRDPRDNVTRRFVRPHVEVRLRLYQYLQHPRFKLNRSKVAALLQEVCGPRNETLRRCLARTSSLEAVCKRLEGQLDELQQDVAS